MGFNGDYRGLIKKNRDVSTVTSQNGGLMGLKMVMSWRFNQKTGMLVDIPSGYDIHSLPWKDPPCY